MENEQTITKRTQKEKSYIYLDMGIEEKLNQCFHFDIAISLQDRPITVENPMNIDQSDLVITTKISFNENNENITSPYSNRYSFDFLKEFNNEIFILQFFFHD